VLNVEESERVALHLGRREGSEGGGREWARRFGLEVSNVCVSLCSSTQNELVPKVKSTLWVSISLKNLALTWNMRSINLPTGHGKF
jgi:hypothetical protein